MPYPLLMLRPAGSPRMMIAMHTPAFMSMETVAVACCLPIAAHDDGTWNWYVSTMTSQLLPVGLVGLVRLVELLSPSPKAKRCRESHHHIIPSSHHPDHPIIPTIPSSDQHKCCVIPSPMPGRRTLIHNRTMSPRRRPSGIYHAIRPPSGRARPAVPACQSMATRSIRARSLLGL
jgi:hypothetical protein